MGCFYGKARWGSEFELDFFFYAYEKWFFFSTLNGNLFFNQRSSSLEVTKMANSTNVVTLNCKTCNSDEILL